MKLLGTIVGWVCALLVAALNLFAAVMKFVPQDPASEGAKFMLQLGITPQLAHVLGVLEFVIVALFLIPRTSTVGFVLMVGYLAGVLATLLTHAQDATPMYVALALVTVSAYFRNPELLWRAKGKSM